MKNRRKIIKIIATLLLVAISFFNIFLSVSEILKLLKDSHNHLDPTFTHNGTTDNKGSDEKDDLITNDGEIATADIVDFHTIRFTFPLASDIKNPKNIKVYRDGVEMTVVNSTVSTESNIGTVEIAEVIDLSKAYTLAVEGCREKIATPGEIYDTEDFKSEFTYDGDDLGATLNEDSTTFKLWAPTASSVTLNLYGSGIDTTPHESVSMTKCDRGVWSYTKNRGHGTYYTYTVTTPFGTSEVTDPYSKSVSADGTKSAVVDLSLTIPIEWQKSFNTGIDSYLDAIICEIDISAFSKGISKSNHKGEYLAFTESGIVNESGVPIGIDHLKSLGITHVKLASVFESNQRINASYFTPSGEYASDTSTADVRIREFKTMVNSLHSAGIGVIIEAAYNYGESADENLDKIVPYYYLRYSSKDVYGNHLSEGSERYMYEKLLTDSITYWMSEYGVDGFCFTDISCHDLGTVQRIEHTVHTLKPDTILFGICTDNKDYTGTTTLADRKNIGKITKTAGAIGSVAVINDTMRDGLVGTSHIASRGYITGNPGASLDDVLFGILGTDIPGASWRVPDSMVVNSLGSIESISLWHKLSLINKSSTEADRLAMYRLGIGIISISKGAVMFPLGEDFLLPERSNAGIDWEAIKDNGAEKEMSEYFRSVLTLRKKYRDFFSADSSITFTKMLNGIATVTISDSNKGRLFIILNPTGEILRRDLDGEWYTLLCDNEFSGATLPSLTSSVTIAAYSMAILVNSDGIQI